MFSHDGYRPRTPRSWFEVARPGLADRTRKGLSPWFAACCVLAFSAGWEAAIAAEPGTSGGMAVTVATVAKACVTDTMHLAGVVVPREELPVKPDGEGWRIAQILVEDGDKVTSGQALARISRLGSDPNAGPTGTLQSPTGGIVLQGTARIGVTISPRAEPPFRIISGGEFELEAELPPRGMSHIKLGQTARADIPGTGAISGRVSFISPDLNPMTQLGRTRVFIGAEPKLRKGQFGNVAIEVGRSCGTTVPFSSILYGAEGPVVQVVRNNRVETRRVRLGLTSGDKAELIEGVSEGDRVVTRAGSFLRDGDAVTAVTAQGETPAARR